MRGGTRLAGARPLDGRVGRLVVQGTSSQPPAVHLSTAADKGFGAFDMTFRVNVRSASMAIADDSEA